MTFRRFIGIGCILLLSLGCITAIGNNLPKVSTSIFQTINLNQHLLWQYPLPQDLELIQLSDNGKTVAISTGREPSTLTIIDGMTGLVLWQFTPTGLAAENRTITCLEISADGEYIVIGTTGGSIYLFQRISNEITQHWQANTSITSVSLSELGTFISIAFTGHLYFLSRLEGGPLWGRILANPPDHILNITSDRVGSYLASSTSNQELFFIRTGDGEILWEYQLSENTTALQLSAGGDLLLTTTQSFCMLFTGLGDLEQIYSAPPRVFAFSTSGNRIAISPNQTVLVFSRASLMPLSNFTFGTETPTSLALTPDGGILLIGTNTGSVYAVNSLDFDVLWMLQLNEPLLHLLPSNTGDTFLAVTPSIILNLRISSVTGLFIYLVPFFIIMVVSIVLGVLTVIIIRPRRIRKLLSEQTAEPSGTSNSE